MNHLFEKIQESDFFTRIVLHYGLKGLGAIFVLIFFWIFAGWASSIAKKTLSKTKVDKTLAIFFSTALRWLILLFAIFTCFGFFGINTTSFATILGAGGLAFGLAFQGALSNVAAGFMLLLFRPFKIGDVVNLDGFLGKVGEIDLFTTSINTLDNRRIIIPNGKIFGSTIENVTFHSKRRVDITIGVSYSSDIEETREVLWEAVNNLDKVLEAPAPEIFLAKLNDYSVDWEIRAWCLSTNWIALRQDINKAVKESLDKNSIEIPFPRMDVSSLG